MKTCTCGGKWHRVGSADRTKASGLDGMRYRCAVCNKSITVRNGEISTQRGRPVVKDWRHEMGTSNDQRQAAA